MALGTALVLAAAVCIGIGLVLQKRGLGSGLRVALRSPVWLAGTAIGLGGFGLYALALGTERLAIVQSLMTLSLLVVAVAEILIFEHKACFRDILTMGLFIVGVTLIAVG